MSTANEIAGGGRLACAMVTTAYDHDVNAIASLLVDSSVHELRLACSFLALAVSQSTPREQFQSFALVMAEKFPGET